MNTEFEAHLAGTLSGLDRSGLLKRERVLASSQGARIDADGRPRVLNLCANNYLGLADHPEIRSAAHAALDRWGYGLASVRFICGTQEIHRVLEQRLAKFLGTEDCILHPSCFDANAGLFEALLGPEDAIVSDALNHASIIDGVRLCKARRFRYRHDDLEDLEAQVRAARGQGARFVLITTDGCFSMDGTVAALDGIVSLAERHGALVHSDECHATGFMGATGRGTHEERGVLGRVDILTGTLGKALGGASGGFVAASRTVVEVLRQKSRPYLFSNSLPPSVVAGAIAAIDILERSLEAKERLERNTRFWRAALEQDGHTVLPGTHPIVPVMLGDAERAQRMAAALLDEGVHAVAFFYPVVPEGRARIRTQMNAAFTQEDLELARTAFKRAAERCRG